jgi:hypothetical protein
VGKVKDVRSEMTVGEVVLGHGADPVLMHGAVEAGGVGAGEEVRAAGEKGIDVAPVAAMTPLHSQFSEVNPSFKSEVLE